MASGGQVKCPLNGADMFFWFLVAVGVVVGLTLLGAFMTRHSGGWDHEDGGPMGPWVDH